MTRSRLRSISVPITFGVVTICLAVALLVGWTLITARTAGPAPDVARSLWLLVGGVLAFGVILTVLALFTVFLSRQILEVRRQDSFIDSVTHELKSPLASIKLCLQTLERPGLDPTQKAELQQMMSADVDRLAAFIDDVLQASRIAHERVGVSLSDVELRPLVEHCADAVAVRHRVDRARLTVSVAPDLKVYSDRAALEIIVRNLVDNAVKYSDPPPSVDVTAALTEDRRLCRIEVQDRGIGVPPGDLSRIFHRFYRVAEERVLKRRGTGLGLFVVSALVRNLGGDVEAFSRGLGTGTRVRVELPAAASGDR